MEETIIHQVDFAWAILGSVGGAYGLVKLLGHLHKQAGRDLFFLLAVFVLYPWAIAFMHHAPFDKGLVYALCEFVTPLYALCVLRLLRVSDEQLRWFRLGSLSIAAGLAALAITNPWHGQFALFEVPLAGEPNHMLDYQSPGIGALLTMIFAGIVVTAMALIAAVRIARSKFSVPYFFMAVILPMAMLCDMFFSADSNLVQQYGVSPFVLTTTITLFSFSFWLRRDITHYVLPLTHAKLLELMPDAMVNVDRNGSVIDCNSAFVKLTGQANAKLAYQPLESFLPDISFLLDDSITHHTVGLRVDGTLRHFDLRIDSLASKGSRPGDKMIMFRDVTEHILAYHDLQNSERKLHAANSELARLSTTDVLTGLRNRRYFQDQLEQKMNELARGATAFGLLSIDIDHFKAINDTHGHQAGDFVLTQVSRVLESQCRLADSLARMGGEEFMVLVASCEKDELLGTAERFRMVVQNHNVYLDDGTHVAVTISIGAALSRSSETMGELMQRVDQRLYAAKHAGRNLSVVSA